MRRRSADARHAFALLALSLTLSACTRGKETADSTTARPTAGARKSALVGAAGTAASLPGALQKPLEQYSADEFAAFVESLAFGGGADKPRKCRKDPACDSGGKQTSARIDAVDGQDSLSATALPTNGVVAARARNTGAYEEARYGMLPGDYQYYLVVLPAADGTATWRLQQLTTGNTARAMTEVATGTFHPCNHPYRKRANRANFYTCSDAHLESDTTMKLRLMMQTGDRIEPLWITCAQGCCTGE